MQQQTGSPKSWRSLDLEHGASVSGMRPSFRTQRSSSMPTPRSTAGAASKSSDLGSAVCHGYAATTAAAVPADLDHSPPGPVDVKERSTRGSVSNENNILLDPEVLTDYPTQALLLTVLVRIIHTFGVAWWRCGRAMDLRLTGLGFKSQPVRFHVTWVKTWHEAHSDSIEFICAIPKSVMYVCMYITQPCILPGSLN